MSETTEALIKSAIHNQAIILDRRARDLTRDHIVDNLRAEKLRDIAEISKNLSIALAEIKGLGG